MRKSRLLFPLLFAVAVHVQASTVIPVDVATQVDQADLIFIGTVIGTESVPVKDRTFAYTYVTFAVEETLKGAASAPMLTLRVAGGQAGKYLFEIAGVPRFATGGRHLLFVQDNDRHPVPLLGGPQGKLNLVRDPVTQEDIVTDEAGRAIDGLRDRNWIRRLQRPERVAEVISQEGVTVVLEQLAEAEAVPASQVIAGLRDFIQGRAFAPGFRRGQTVQSASPADVPHTGPFREVVRPEAH